MTEETTMLTISQIVDAFPPEPKYADADQEKRVEDIKNFYGKLQAVSLALSAEAGSKVKFNSTEYGYIGEVDLFPELKPRLSETKLYVVIEHNLTLRVINNTIAQNVLIIKTIDLDSGYYQRGYHPIFSKIDSQELLKNTTRSYRNILCKMFLMPNSGDDGPALEDADSYQMLAENNKAKPAARSATKPTQTQPQSAPAPAASTQKLTREERINGIKDQIIKALQKNGVTDPAELKRKVAEVKLPNHKETVEDWQHVKKMIVDFPTQPPLAAGVDTDDIPF